MRWPWTRTTDSAWRPEFDALARYNGEKARGLVHTPEWQHRMTELQRLYDETYHRSAG